jgi:hypothetical protein
MYQGQFEERRAGLYQQKHCTDRVIGLYGERSITGGYSPEKKIEATVPKHRKGAGIKYWYIDLETGIIGYGAESFSDACNCSVGYIQRNIDTRFKRSPDKECILEISRGIKKKPAGPRKTAGAPTAVRVRHVETGVVYASVKLAAGSLGYSTSLIRCHIDPTSTIKNRLFERV